jgi:hypothetical protein
MTAERAPRLRCRILKLIAEYHAVAFSELEFIPGETRVAVSGMV